MNNIFVDSNIVLYLMDIDEQKKIISRKLLSNNPNISTQVLTEVANVCKYRFKYKKHELLILWSDLLRDCTLIPTNNNSIQKAIQLVKRYDFQLFDALIVADALTANCTALTPKICSTTRLSKKRLQSSIRFYKQLK